MTAISAKKSRKTKPKFREDAGERLLSNSPK
jgi:hypothetical protein